MPSLTSATGSALGQVLASVGAAGNVLTKSMMMLDRLTDAGYSHADTFALNTELRNKGSIDDTLLDEEKRNLERTIERLRFEEQLASFLGAHPNLNIASNQTSQSKPASTKTTKSSSRAA